MQIAATRGAAGTGVSEAKLRPFPGQNEAAAEAGESSPLESIQQAVIADVATLSEFAATTMLAPTQLLQPPGAFQRIAVPEANSMQIASAGNAAAGVSDAKFASSSGSAGAVIGVAPAKALEQPEIAAVATAPEIAAADLLKLAQILKPANLPERTVRVDNLIRETVSAISEGRIEFAVGRLIEVVMVDPARVDEIRSMPEFEAIRANVEHVVAHLTNVAKMDAETKLTSAEQLFEDAGYKKLPHWETEPAALINVGHRLIEAGGYANYVRTADLATTLQSAYWNASAIQPPLPNATVARLKEEGDAHRRNGASPTTLVLVRYAWDALREEFSRRVAALWMRASLLVLFGIWFTLGLVGGVVSRLARIIWQESWIVRASHFGFEIWGLGVLALVGLGFWARSRKLRR